MNDLEKLDALPSYTVVDEYAVSRRRRRFLLRTLRFTVLAVVGWLVYTHWIQTPPLHGSRQHLSTLSIDRLRADHAVCTKLRTLPVDPSGPRDRNARYVDGQPSILIRNATVWTGEPALGTSEEDAHAGKGWSWVRSDVLLEKGLITKVEPDIALHSLELGTQIWDAHGRLLTAGIVDMHSHAGDDPLPSLRGGEDENELSNDITPYVRSIDGINPLDPQIQVIKSGGVSTSLILMGSGNNIGGEAFVVKHAVGKADGRPELSVESMLADKDRNWRYIKMACGENPKRVYGRVGRSGPFSRPGEAWYFRHAFEQARNYVRSQDDWCNAADALGAENMPSYLPQEIEWELLGAVLRGQVHVNTHCYTIPDLEAYVRHTNEFQFPVRAFHHAHQTYLVPEILKRAYGNHTPAAALFADNMYYKVEAYIASEQAGKILYENGITPVYVSDNPVLNAQHVLFEAAKAYRNGLPYHAALSAVTSAPAWLLGLGERVGKVKPGFDADVVVWDSDPLSVGATPVQLWIDGVPQFEDPVELEKETPEVPKANKELQTVHDDSWKADDLIITGVKKIWLPEHGYDTVEEVNGSGVLIIRNGKIECFGVCTEERMSANNDGLRVLDLTDAYVAPPMTAFGSFLGLSEIAAEEETGDSSNTENSFSAAIDGLALDTKNLRTAYRHGVLRAITAPSYYGDGHRGLSVGFQTGAKHTLEPGTVWAPSVAVHYTLTTAAKNDKTPSLSSAVDELRTKLLKAISSNETENVSLETQSLKGVVNGSLPLVVTVHSADTIAAVLRLKTEVEAGGSETIRMVIFGGAESHIVATELAAANVGVVLAPFRAYSAQWDQRRSLTGAPLTNGTAVDVLHAAGVKVAISTAEDWETRDLNLLAGIAHANGRIKSGDGKTSSNGISEKEALAMVSSNIYDMLGIKEPSSDRMREFVVYEGNPLTIEGRVRAVVDGRGVFEVWD